MGSGFVQFPIPGVYQPNAGGPRFGPTFDGLFSSGLTTHPYVNGLLDLTNLYQQIIGTSGLSFTSGGFTAAPPNMSGDPFSAAFFGSDPFASASGNPFGGFSPVMTGFGTQGFTSPAGFTDPFGGFVTPGQNPFFNATGGGFTPTGYGGFAFPLPGVYQPNAGGPRFGPTFDGLFSSGLTTHPYTNGILDGVNQFSTIISLTGPVM